MFLLVCVYACMCVRVYGCERENMRKRESVSLSIFELVIFLLVCVCACMCVRVYVCERENMRKRESVSLSLSARERGGERERE